MIGVFHDYTYKIRGWLTDINSVNFGQLSPTELAGELAKGLMSEIENQEIKIKLDVAELNSGTKSEVKIEDEAKYRKDATTEEQKTKEERRDVAQDDVLATNPLTDEIDLSRMGEVIDKDNIKQALETLSLDLEAELINLGVTDATARELVQREVETFYRTTWTETVANDDDNDLYAQHFDYTNGLNPQYNGNISASTWRVRGKDKQHYEYAYDDLNRLRSADYHAVNSNAQNYNTGGYDMAATYDLNGNINTMWRKGSTAEDNLGVATAFGVIDDMTYSYVNNSNTLTKVSDNGLNTDGFKDGTNTGNDYTYDDNGNLISDKNKDITSITYNHLNLPSVITFANGNTITWLYDAAGVKLQKRTYEYANNTTNTKDYIGGIEYNNNTIEAVYTDEGRAMPNGSTYRYEYTIKDHLGNSRVMFSDIDNDGQVDENEIIQEEHYYPFGMRHEGYGRTITHGENDYQYNGKELNTDFGLDWYSYGFRKYDAAIGRFPSCDPAAERFAFVSPYNYAENNPSTGIDLYGLQFLNANDAKIIISSSGISLKYENLRNVTKAAINSSAVVTGTREVYNEDCDCYHEETYITKEHSMWIEEYSNYSIVAPRTMPSESFRETAPKRKGGAKRKALMKRKGVGARKGARKMLKAEKKRNKKYKNMKPSVGGRGAKPMGKGGGIFQIVGEVLAFSSIVGVSLDYREAHQQKDNYAKSAIEMVKAAVDDGTLGIGPDETVIYDIANYIFQGEFTQTYDPDEYNDLKNKALEIMANNSVPIQPNPNTFENSLNYHLNNSNPQ